VSFGGRKKGAGVEWGRTEVDGVPTFWSRHDGERKAGLVFRVGHADEQLARRGITHLVEHLALHELGHRPDHVNGAVDVATTTFVTRGSDQEITGFLAGVCRALCHLPTDRMALENQVLLTEAGRVAGQSVGSALAIWRYGAATYGLTGYEELGVGHHDSEELRRWVSRWFTRGNAALWLIGGPPPADLRLELPAGPRVPPPQPSSTLPRTPAYFPSHIDGVAASSVVRRSVAATAYAELLRRRLYERLRMAEGISYSPVTSYDRRDGQMAQITAFVDGLEAVHARLVDGFVAVVDRLAEEPPSARDVTEIADLLKAPLREPGAASGWVVGAARDELFGAASPSFTDLLAEIDELSQEQLTAAAAEARDDMLLMVPCDHRPPGGRYSPAPSTSDAVVDGRVFLAAESSLPRAQRTIGPGNDSRARLCVGPTGISLVEGRTFMTVRFDQCEAMLSWPDGARHLIGRDGLHLRVEPTMWREGHLVPDLLDRGVPPAVVITRPSRPADEIPRPAHVGSWDRIRARLRRT
jgi:zinc protease